MTTTKNTTPNSTLTKYRDNLTTISKAEIKQWKE